MTVPLVNLVYPPDAIRADDRKTRDAAAATSRGSLAGPGGESDAPPATPAMTALVAVTSAFDAAALYSVVAGLVGHASKVADPGACIVLHAVAVSERPSTYLHALGNAAPGAPRVRVVPLSDLAQASSDSPVDSGAAMNAMGAALLNEHHELALVAERARGIGSLRSTSIGVLATAAPAHDLAEEASNHGVDLVLAAVPIPVDEIREQQAGDTVAATAASGTSAGEGVLLHRVPIASRRMLAGASAVVSSALRNATSMSIDEALLRNIAVIPQALLLLLSLRGAGVQPMALSAALRVSSFLFVCASDEDARTVAPLVQVAAQVTTVHVIVARDSDATALPTVDADLEAAVGQQNLRFAPLSTLVSAACAVVGEVGVHAVVAVGQRTVGAQASEQIGPVKTPEGMVDQGTTDAREVVVSAASDWVPLPGAGASTTVCVRSQVLELAVRLPSSTLLLAYVPRSRLVAASGVAVDRALAPAFTAAAASPLIRSTALATQGLPDTSTIEV